MEIESQLSGESNALTPKIYENIGDYSDGHHLQPLMTTTAVNSCHNSETPMTATDAHLAQQHQQLMKIEPSVQTSMDNTYHTLDNNNSDICLSPTINNDDGQHVMDTSGNTTNIDGSGSPTRPLLSSRDRFCWVCHKDKGNIQCRQCPRCYHLRCIPITNGDGTVIESKNNKSMNKTLIESFESWICLECKDIIKEEENLQSMTTDDSEELPPKSLLAQMTIDEMSELLTFALQTIRLSADLTFHKPVSHIVFPDYHELVHCPMDLSTIENKINSNRYRSQAAFLADIKWIVHNCIIYNHNNHPLTTNAKYLSRVAKNEMVEMDICPDCFRNFYTVTESSFAEPCRRPHQLVFARVKGYPLWPAKTVRLGNKNEVDCRFFGTHDRAWVTVDSCWLVSEVHPGSKPNKTHKAKFEGAMRELAVHVERLNARFPKKFKYSPSKTSFSAKQIFILDEDNDYYNKLIDYRLQTVDDKSPNGAADISANSNENSNKSLDNNSNDTNDKSGDESGVTNITKPVAPGVFSLTSDKVLDELKSEIKISNESTNLLNKNIKSNSQLKDDKSANACARTARVGKRNVAEALRASKIMRTGSNSSQTSSFAPTVTPSSNKQQTNQSSNANNTSQQTTTANASVVKPKGQSTVTSPQLISNQNNSTINNNNNSNNNNNNFREELERLKKQIHYENAMHRQEIREIKHNSDLVLMEMRQSWVTERDKALEDQRQKHDLERKLLMAQFDTEKKRLLSSIEETKRKQWCGECLKEAQLFCCYDTWYCTYECQKSHWKSHVNVCQQIQRASTSKKS